MCHCKCRYTGNDLDRNLDMKPKLIMFIVFFPIFELIAFILTYLGQAIYSIRVLDNTTPFIDLFLEYIKHPINAAQECIATRNPLIFFLPILFFILLIMAMTVKERQTSRIDDSGIYGTANWATIESLTSKNIVGKRKFDTCTKKKFLNDFLESIDIDENTKKETKAKKRG